MKNFKSILLVFVMLFSASFVFTSCRTVDPNAGEVAVLVDQPWVFGKGGVRSYVWGTGRQYTWPSTHYVIYKVTPITYKEDFENIITKDNNPISFSSYIKITVMGDSAWYLHQTFLVDWYNMNISPRFRTKVRDKSCSFEMFQLTSQREITAKIEMELQTEMQAYVNSIHMPVIIDEINIGSVQPQPEVLQEIANTAARVQNNSGSSLNITTCK